MRIVPAQPPHLLCISRAQLRTDDGHRLLRFDDAEGDSCEMRQMFLSRCTTVSSINKKTILRLRSMFFIIAHCSPLYNIMSCLATSASIAGIVWRYKMFSVADRLFVSQMGARICRSPHGHTCTCARTSCVHVLYIHRRFTIQFSVCYRLFCRNKILKCNYFVSFERQSAHQTMGQSTGSRTKYHWLILLKALLWLPTYEIEYCNYLICYANWNQVQKCSKLPHILVSSLPLSIHIPQLPHTPILHTTPISPRTSYPNNPIILSFTLSLHIPSSPTYFISTHTHSPYNPYAHIPDLLTSFCPNTWSSHIVHHLSIYPSSNIPILQHIHTPSPHILHHIILSPHIPHLPTFPPPHTYPISPTYFIFQHSYPPHTPFLHKHTSSNF